MTSVMTFHNTHNIHYKRVMTIRPKIFMQNERKVSLCDYYSTLFSAMRTLHSNAFFHLKDDIGYTHGPKYSGSLIKKTIRFVWECKIIKNQLVLQYSIIVIFNDA